MPFRSFATTPSFRTWKRKRADLAIQYTDAVNQFGPNYPKVQRLQAQMKEVDDQMSRERKGISRAT